ncbi:integrase catalytic domain-containing protein [Trichonephila inaurata madagascariensis]|uniref:Integrase catalytic domain-containing protein n=1 Tax=Trichonephila inaurata madagascariensis TaxID=2747483 RepID=A0A8X7C4Q1_9ARAC|nr:integrase catalytic domain-containing protein [Trichonephila inaurata madagascariensis]
MEYREKITTWKFRANKKLNSLRISTPNETTHKITQSQSEITLNSSLMNALKNMFQEKVKINLPKLSNQKFYGEMSQWLTFWNSFESAIHKNTSLDKISKFNYLKAFLGGSALQTVEGFAITSENYDSAIKMLENRFGNKEILINTHMNRILNISPFKNSNDVKSFRKRKELEDAAREHFLKTVRRNEEGRYIVSLPWVENNPPLSDCRSMAEKRLERYVKSLERSKRLFDYERVFENWLEEDIIEKFNLRGWECSHKLLELNNSDEETKVVPVLGLNWNLPSDTLSIDVKYFSEEKGTPVTKRQVLSAVHRIFDPIGFTCPITLTPKLLLQECWRMGISRDVELPLEMRIKFENWKLRIPLLKELSIPRYLLKNSSPYAKVTMHIFCDASQSAYAACVFIITEFENNISCEFFQARNSEQIVGTVKKDFSKVRKASSIKEGDIVLLGSKRINWPLSNVKKIYTGIVHVVEIQTKNGTFLRPVQRLYLLEVGESGNFPFPGEESTPSVANGHSTRELPSVPDPVSTKTDHQDPLVQRSR